MNSDQPKFRRNVFLVVVVLIIGAVLMIIYLIHYQSLTGTLNIAVSPGDSKITINSGHGKVGINKVKPGGYSVKFSRSGFNTVTKNVVVQKDQIIYVNSVLSPSTPATANWYATHPKDESLAEGISSTNTDQLSQKSVVNNSLITLLPFVGPDFEYRIDYGQAPGANNNLPVIYITGATPQDQQAGLAWIKSQGFNPATMNIQYVTAKP